MRRPTIELALLVAVALSPWPSAQRPAAHWAYRAPAVDPAVADDYDAGEHPIDRLVRARLRPLGIDLADPAPRAILLRRASLDLTGLPPSPDEVAAFERDPDARAFERAVDRLLSSPHFGEHQAAMWLDLARYADTKGYEKDDRRTIWRYRDWVIDALNADMPFDRFTIEQLAGDLLPDATTEQLVATAFHRNTMTNDEGGTDDEEFRVAAVVDRVNTTMEVWMGTTMACAQCHDHKYDPFTQREYYELFAFLNNTADADRADEAPTIPTPTPEQARELARIDAELRDLRRSMDADSPDHAAARRAWERDELLQLAQRVRLAPKLGPWHVAGPFAAPSFRAAHDTAFAPERGDDVAWTPRPDWRDGVVHAEFTAPNAAHYLRRDIDAAAAGPLTLSFGSDDSIKAWVNEHEVLAALTSRAAAADQERVTADLTAGTNTLLVKIVNGGGPSGFWFRAEEHDLPRDVVFALPVPEADRSADQRAAVAAAWQARAPELAEPRARAAELARARAATDVPTTPILRELPPDRRRSTAVMIRGNFLDRGDQVEPRTPAVFPPLPDGVVRDRLALARWLVDPRNPLTARVTVNRFWQRLFGRGLVETSEDFGRQGEPPTHPELLDWLATEFVRRGWSVKALLRTIVLSATYRQSSRWRPELADLDPYNRLLGRGPRFRLSAEAVRDQALRIAGLLSPRIGGPSVMPPQPDGVWNVVYSNDRWTTSPGDDRYRRALYTFWRRTSPYPSLVMFDAPSREVCVSHRVRTNTPLQALVTLNDPVYVEAAQALARRIVAEAGPGPRERAAHGMRLAVARAPSDAEVARLCRLFEDERERFRHDERGALALAPGSTAPAELAAWTVVANVLLNLDEVLTKG
jgi:hypothetical protein